MLGNGQSAVTMTPQIVPVEPDLTPYVAHGVGSRMRPGDAEECRAFGYDPVEGVALSLRASLYARAMWEPDHGYGAAWGVVAPNVLGGKVNIWLLTTDRAPANRKFLFYEGKRFVDDALARYGEVEAYVLVSYEKSVAWLKRWGFSMEDVWHVGGEPFFIARKRG